MLSVTLVLVFAVVSTDLWNLVLAGLFSALSFVAIWRCRTRRHWFYTAVLEAFASSYLLEQEDWAGKMSIATDVERRDG